MHIVKIATLADLESYLHTSFRFDAPHQLVDPRTFSKSVEDLYEEVTKLEVTILEDPLSKIASMMRKNVALFITNGDAQLYAHRKLYHSGNESPGFPEEYGMSETLTLNETTLHAIFRGLSEEFHVQLANEAQRLDDLLSKNRRTSITSGVLLRLPEPHGQHESMDDIPFTLRSLVPTRDLFPTIELSTPVPRPRGSRAYKGFRVFNYTYHYWLELHGQRQWPKGFVVHEKNADIQTYWKTPRLRVEHMVPPARNSKRSLTAASTKE